KHWHDTDGLTPPSPLLVIAINEVLQKWKDGKSEIISAKPLPDTDELNATILVKEWEIDLNGQPSPPWKYTVVIYFVSPATGECFTYSNSTVGAIIAFNHLKEAVVAMRILRGSRVLPLVNLSERPMKTKFGQKLRPHLEIIGWKTPGGEAPMA